MNSPSSIATTRFNSPSTHADDVEVTATGERPGRQENHFTPINFWLGGSFPFAPSS